MSENDLKSLSELRNQIKDEHLEITCTTTVPVSITIVYTDEYKEPGYIVSLDYPPPSQQGKPFIGDPRVVCRITFRFSDSYNFSWIAWKLSGRGSMIDQHGTVLTRKFSCRHLTVFLIQTLGEKSENTIGF